jgi:hypothetical protein
MQGSQARQRVEIDGPKARYFGNFGKVFDQLINIWGPKQGAFRPIPAKMHTARLQRPLRGSWSKLAKALPWWHQLIEISKGSLRALLLLLLLLLGLHQRALLVDVAPVDPGRV